MKKIFVIEGEWDDKLYKDLTVKSSLSLLKEVSDIDFIFRKTNTVESLISYLKTSSKSTYKNYSVLMIASHGSRYDIELSKDQYIDLVDLADVCEGMFTGKIVHFSSCSIAGNESRLSYFKETTGAIAVSGYSKTIEFLESSILDIVLLNKLCCFKNPISAYKNIIKNYPYLQSRLGFSFQV